MIGEREGREGKRRDKDDRHSLHYSENAVPPEVERDAHITQGYWMEIRHVVRCIYRDDMNLSGEWSYEWVWLNIIILYRFINEG